MADLPTDVRDRAEIAAYQAYVHVAPGPQSDRWGAVVDAVAEVLAADQRPPNDYSGGTLRSERELLLEAQVAELEEKLLDAEDDQRSAVMAAQHRLGADMLHERDALQARVAELSTQHLHLSHEVEALEEWNFWLSRTLRDMARRATGLRQNARRAVSREMGYRLSSGETVAEMRHRQTLGELAAMRAEKESENG